jgi:hypothetical protein
MSHIDVMKQALDGFIKIEKLSGMSAPVAVNALRKAIKDAEKNQFNPDWNEINLLSEENLALHKRIAELEAEKVEPSLKVIKGEICYKSYHDDQSFGMWCPVNYDSEHGFAEGTKFYTATPMDEYVYAIEAKLKEKNT